jgi:rhodanese-related sulfurtransferase/YHS domain-containing protein
MIKFNLILLVAGTLLLPGMLAVAAGCHQASESAVKIESHRHHDCEAGVCATKPAEKVSKNNPQTVCPVMGGRIDKNVYTDHEGQRIYFCCPACKPAFEKDPDKYLQKMKEAGVTPKALTKEKPEQAAINITTPVLEVLLAANPKDLVLLDARGGDLRTTLPGARRLTDKATAEEAAAVIPAKNSLVVTYCGNPKCQAAPHLERHLRKLGYTNVLVYPEGIEGWVEANNKTETTEESARI